MTKLLAKRILNGTARRTWFNATRLLERHTLFTASDGLLEKVNEELEKFWFVGCVERMDRDIPLIAKRIGIPGSLQRSNVSGKDFNRLLRLDETLEKKLNADNIIDTNLYQYWQSKLDGSSKRLL